MSHIREMGQEGPRDELTADELAHLERANDFTKSGMAYAQEHATRPGTIGLVLSSSPLATLAW